VGPLDVRRLAALDMHGLAGARMRRRVILAEFVLGAVGCIVIGLLTATRAPGTGWRVIGVWLAGIGVNYVALALHAMSLSRTGALDAELAGVAVGSELRRYTYLQLWIVVPLLLAVLAALQLRRRQTPLLPS
jgi:ABC-type Fe3+-siderophore transport system permease subunit